MMRKAVIDIGSNTINLLVVNVDGEEVDVLYDEKRQAELVKGSHINHTLSQDAMDRAYSVLEYFVDVVRSFDIELPHVNAFATASLRGKLNASVFIEKVLHYLDLKINIISGDDEATLIYKGVTKGFMFHNETVLIIDIGGGSVEFIVADSSHLLWKKSYDIGVVKLMDLIACKDPLDAHDVTQITELVKQTILELNSICKKYHIRKLIGASGAFDTFRDLLCAKSHSVDNTTYYSLNGKQASTLLDELGTSTLLYRKQMPAMDMDRVVYIPVAVVLIKAVLFSLHIDELWQCSYSLKEGALF